jgi:hypothetical protein
MRFNADSVRILIENGAPTHVLLMWDKENLKIGFTPAAKSDDRAYLMWYSRNKTTAQFAAKGFASQIGWAAEHGVRVPLRWTKGMLEGTLPAEHLAPTLSPLPMTKTENAKHRRTQHHGKKE